jgi:hypothetical protein
MRRLSVLLACVAIALTLIAITVASGASAAPKQQAAPKYLYGALDWSKAQGSYRYWGSGTSKAAANRAAYDACSQLGGATDCVTVAWVYNGWVVVAQGSNQFRTGWGRTKQQASNAAVKRCQAAGTPPCKVVWLGHAELDPNRKTTGGYSLPGP